MGIHKNDIAFALTLFLIAVGGLLFRLPQLDLRPMHGDEANQAFKAGILLEQGQYAYDPKEHHGPTLYYLAQIPLRLCGITRFADATESLFRIQPVVFGAALILLLWLLRDGLGRGAALVAALLTAISPAMVFYSRYFIQEMLLVFFTFLALACIWRYLESRAPVPLPEEKASGHTAPKTVASWPWALLAGIAIGLMHATKETAVLAWAAMGAAVLYSIVTQRNRNPFQWRDLGLAALAAALTSMLFFSSFLTHPRGILDSVLTYTSYIHRAGGAGMHDHPWYFYLSLLLYTKRPFGPRWSEALIIFLAIAGICAAFAPAGKTNARFPRFLAVYTVVLTVLYALIPYKTPWSMLSFMHGMILLAGVGAVALFRWVRYWPLKAAVAVLLALAAAQLAGQAWRANYLYPSDYRNPYVYAHPVPDVLRLSERFEDLAKTLPQGHELVVKVMLPGSDYWPLPWYLRAFNNVGYWPEIPADPDADVLIAARGMQPELDSRLKNQYQVEFYGLRPDIILAVYIRQDLWDAFMRARG